jgi:voltage-gated potassium channel Kch
MKIKASRRERFQYWIDNQFSRGTITLIKWLALLSLALITIAAIILSIFNITPPGESKITFVEAFWRSLMRTLDAGTMGGDEGSGFRIVMFLVTLSGIFVISTLIGILTAGVEGKLDSLRKGRSRVLEQNHIILLGWSDQIFILLNELMEANNNIADAVLVVLGNEDKTVMEETIQQRVNFKGKTRIVCRSGNPLEQSDLNMVSLNTSRAVIIFSPGGRDADNQVIKTVLAVTNHPNRDPEHKLNVVAEIYDPRNMEAARIISHSEVEWIQVSDFIARVIAQTCRQSGLSVVYTELLDFCGDEVYFHPQPELIGKTFAEALQMYSKNAVIGICPQNGTPRLNPPNNVVLQSGDELILMAADDDEIHYRPDLICIQHDQISINFNTTIQPESALILGWNRRGCAIVHELNNYAPPGSQILVVANSDEIANQMDASCKELTSLKIAYQNGDTTSRSLLDSLNLKQFDHIILLCYSDTLDTQQADSRTLITLLHLRDIATKKDCHFSIVSEMLDVRNRNLADITRADDFIVSDRLVSLMMAQVAENPRLNLVFQDLFDPEGSEIYLKPASDFIKTGVPVNFYTVVEAASQQNSIALGYRLHTQIADSGIMYGVHLNPLKTETVVFSPEDRIILLAEE